MVFSPLQTSFSFFQSNTEISSIVLLLVMILLASISKLFAIYSHVFGFPQILITGATGLPNGVPRPVVKTIILAPAAARAVMDTTSNPGSIINHNPFISPGFSVYLITPCIGDFPALAIFPNDFSSGVLSPPAIFPGDRFSPENRLNGSFIFSATSSFIALLLNKCTAPPHSANSGRIEVPPKFTNLSDTIPRVGFAVSPDVASDPPHSKPNVMCEKLKNSLFNSFASLSNPLQISIPFSIAPIVPPFTSCILKDSTGFFDSLILSAKSMLKRFSHPNPITRAPYTFGLLPRPAKILNVFEKFLPLWPHPWGCVIATALPIFSATLRATVFAHTTEDITTILLRIPTLPLERKYPKKPSSIIFHL